MIIWSYMLVDYNLAHDDPKGAADNCPAQAWQTRDEAKRMAESDWDTNRAEMRAEDSAFDSELVDRSWDVPLSWCLPLPDGTIEAEVNTDQIYRVFPIEFVTPTDKS